MSHGGFTVKIRVCNGESWEEVLSLFGSSIWDLPWNTKMDTINMHLVVNFSPKKRGIDEGVESNATACHLLDDVKKCIGSCCLKLSPNLWPSGVALFINDWLQTSITLHILREVWVGWFYIQGSWKASSSDSVPAGNGKGYTIPLLFHL